MGKPETATAKAGSDNLESLTIRYGRLGCLAVVLLVVAGWIEPNKVCSLPPSEYLEFLKKAQKAGVVIAASAGKLIVEDQQWSEIPHDTKVSLALHAYCLNTVRDDRGSLLVKAYRSGKTLGSIVDGYWQGD